MDPYPASFELGDDPDTARHGLRSGELLLGFDEALTTADIDGFLAARELQEHEEPEGTATRHVLRSFSMRWVDVQPPESTRDTARQLLATMPELWMASPVYAPVGDDLGAAAVAPIPGVLLARVRPEAELALGVLAELGLQLDEEWSGLFGSMRRFIVTGRSPDDGFELVRRLGADPAVEAAALDWLRLDPVESPLMPAPTGITHWAKQWNLKAARFPQAWKTSKGSTSVRIAVIDFGFDLGHTSMTGAWTAPSTHRFYGVNNAQSSDVSIDMTEEKDPVDFRWHGTAVSGIIGGRKGVAGAAGQCRVLPIRVHPASGSNVAGGLRWASTHGARVANLSLSISPAQTELDPVAAALAEPAVAKMVICAAAGNVLPANAAVKPPARLPQIVAVGATVPGGGVKKVTGAAGDEVWMSATGNALDVVAPGLLVPTVDARGAAGFNAGGPGRGVSWYGRAYTPKETGDNAGAYLFCFTGTSAACAHVAALAGLIVSRKKTLAAGAVRALIEASCGQIPGEFYWNNGAHPNGPWSDASGHGLINAEKALAAIP